MPRLRAVSDRSLPSGRCTLLKMDTNCTAPSRIPTVNGTTVRSFSTHGQQSAAKGSSTTVSRSDIRLIQHLDSSAHGLVRRWLLIGYFAILHNPPPCTCGCCRARGAVVVRGTLRVREHSAGATLRLILCGERAVDGSISRWVGAGLELAGWLSFAGA
jgi:hypothetical protein